MSVDDFPEKPQSLPSREGGVEKPPLTFGEATINGRDVLIGWVPYLEDFNSFPLFDPQTKEMIGKPNQITIGIGIFDNPDKVGEKDPVYGDLPTPRNVKGVVDYMLNFFGAKESPVRATQVLLKYDPALTGEYRIRERNRSAMTNDPVERHYYGLMRSDYYGWKLRVDHATDPEVLAQLGITQDQLYEGNEKNAPKLQNWLLLP